MSEHAAPVQATPTPAPQVQSTKGIHLQRKCACGSYGSGGGSCDKCRADGKKLQRTAIDAETPDGLPESVHEVLGSNGHSLDAATRSWMEPRFNYDFSGVRVHTDSRAARSAKEVNALAYTVGRDVVFGAGQYAPGTERGTHLLAHELTHVVQQTSSGASAQQASKAVSEPSDAAEVEADATANRIMTGAPVSVTQTPSATLHALNDLETGLLAGGLALGGVGLTFLALGLAGVFDAEHYSPQELTEYLTVLATTRRIENNRNSDNKARDVVRHWRANETAFNIDNGFRARGGSLTAVELKRLLIREMLSGVTAGEDEEAILTILENSTPEEVLQILDPTNGIPAQTLDDKIGGENHRRFEAVQQRARGGTTSERPAADTGMPRVTIGNFRNSGAVSSENECPICPQLPGLGLAPDQFRNIMELRGDITGHRSEIEYDFKRTKEVAVWRHDGGGWNMLGYEGPGAPDDIYETDEDVTPTNNHIYAVDAPGFPGNFRARPDADIYSYRGNFVESVNARVAGGEWTPVSNQFDWHSTVRIEKVDGQWQRSQGLNEIEPGHIVIGQGTPA